MYCASCGKQIEENSAFCEYCGVKTKNDNDTLIVESAVQANNEVVAGANVPSEQIASAQTTINQPQKPKGRGRFLLGFISGILICAILGVGFLKIGTFNTSESQVEGKAFETPELAVEAYLNAFKEADVNKMIAAFSVESFAENSDLEVLINQIRAYTTSLTPKLPSTNTLTIGINANQRIGDITLGIYFQYVSLFLPQSEVGAGKPIIFDDERDIKDFAEDLGDSRYLDDLQSLEIISFVDPGSMSELYNSDSNRKVIERQRQRYGVDDIESVIARANISGTDYLFFFDVGKYNDGWYIISFGGNIANLLSVASYSGGVVPEKEF